MNKLILIGAGGHSKVIRDIALAGKEYVLSALLADTIQQTTEIDGILYANTDYLYKLQPSELTEYSYLLAIGHNATRRDLFTKLAIPLEQYATLIHPSAVVSPSAKIGPGTVIMPQAVINAAAVVGNHCIINTGAVVEHDNKLEDYVHISPNATLCGTVSIGEGSQVGAGAVIIPGKKVGNWSIVGAGAAVTKDVGDGVTVAGIPAKEKRYHI